MPIPTENRECNTVDDVVAGAEEWGDTEILTEEKLRGFAQRMLNAAGDYNSEAETRLCRGEGKIRIIVSHQNFAKADEMGSLLLNGYRAQNALVQEIFRLRAQLALLRKTTQEARDDRE
jgi:hypothetical protein